LIVIPTAYAYGFLVMEPASEMLYLHTVYYAPESDGRVTWNDPVRVATGHCAPPTY